jgi:hypothetical protein
MRPRLFALHTLLRPLWLAATLLVAGAAQATPVSHFVPYAGQGNVSVFDASAGAGGWVGSIDEVPDPANAQPLSLVSVVLFTLDRAAHTLAGTFEFTTTDLLSTLRGEVSGTFVNDDILSQGGQFSLDYQILGGSGQFLRANGFGLAFVDFNPNAPGDNYSESGLLSFTVPTPATLALVLTGLLGLSLGTRHAARPRAGR